MEDDTTLPSLASNAAYNAIYQVLRLAFPLITYPYISRIIGPVGIGKVSFSQTVADYFSMVALLGLPVYGVRAVGMARSNPVQRDQVFGELLTLSLGLSVLALGAYVAMPYVIPSMTAEPTLYWAFGISILINGFNVDWFFHGNENYKYITIRNIVIRSATTVLVFVIVRRQGDYISYGLLWIVGSLLTNGVATASALKMVGMRLRVVRLGYHLRAILPTAAMVLASTMYSSLDTMMLGAMVVDDRRSVGLYTLAGRILRIAISIVVAVTAVAMPRVAARFAEGRLDSVGELIRKNLTFVVFLSFPMAVGMMIMAEEIVVGFAGTSFRDAITTMQILAPEVVLIAVNGVLTGQALYARGREKTVLAVTCAGLLVAGALNYWLIPHGAQNGAAVATLLTRSVEVVLLSWLSWEFVSSFLISTDAYKIAIITVFLSAIMLVLRWLLIEHQIIVRLTVIGVSGLVFFGGAALLWNLTPALQIRSFLYRLRLR